MAKEAYYFSHDYEPLSDPKLLALVGEYGAAGYGIYWRIVEMLHSDENHRLEHEQYIYCAIAKQMLTPVEHVENVLKYAIDVCKLFVSDGKLFWSERVFKNIGKREEIVEKRRNAGRASAEARRRLSQQNPTPAEQVATRTSKRKKRKENEIKVSSYKERLLTEIIASEFPEMNPEYCEAAKAFQNLFKQNLIDAGASTKTVDNAKGNWIDDIRHIVLTDGYTIDDLRSAYSFLQKNDFWKKNILSTSKLREKMDKLKMEIKNGTTTNRTTRKENTSWNELASIVSGAFGDAQ